MPKHTHADLMLLYAQDAAKTDKPWELWECSIYTSEGGPVWSKLGEHPRWERNVMYRRIPEKTDLKKYGVEKGDVWGTTSGISITVYSVGLVKVTSLRGKSYHGNELTTLTFRRGVVDKL